MNTNMDIMKQLMDDGNTEEMSQLIASWAALMNDDRLSTSEKKMAEAVITDIIKFMKTQETL